MDPYFNWFGSRDVYTTSRSIFFPTESDQGLFFPPFTSSFFVCFVRILTLSMTLNWLTVHWKHKQSLKTLNLCLKKCKNAKICDFFMYLGPIFFRRPIFSVYPLYYVHPWGMAGSNGNTAFNKLKLKLSLAMAISIWTFIWTFILSFRWTTWLFYNFANEHLYEQLYEYWMGHSYDNWQIMWTFLGPFLWTCTWIFLWTLIWSFILTL